MAKSDYTTYLVGKTDDSGSYPDLLSKKTDVAKKPPVLQKIRELADRGTPGNIFGIITTLQLTYHSMQRKARRS